MSTVSEERYVPPHLRNRPASSSDSGPLPTRLPQPTTKLEDSSRDVYSPPNRRPSTPWSSSNDSRSNWSDSLSIGRYPQPHSAPTRHNRQASERYAASPTLYVFGDSFAGPLKLLSDGNARVTTFKGSSAKGLNNPKSIKQVSKDLVPALNYLLVHKYMPAAGRWALLIFGNVDLQINYLWQLQHKPITPASFPSPSIRSKHPNSDTPSDATQESSSASNVTSSSHLLATATETSITGPALGPELFVESVVKAYTTWLEREIVNGPFGKKMTERQDPSSQSSESIRRKQPPSKVLIAAALPPLVEDETLHRIPEKYVERMEEDHAKAQRAMEGYSPAPLSGRTGAEVIDEGMSTLTMTDPATTPTSSKSTSSSTQHSSTDSHTGDTVSTSISALSSPPSDSKSDGKSNSKSDKTSISELLHHDPPLCTLPVRIKMTSHYNSLLSTFCARHPDILAFIDITPSILAGNASDFVDPVTPSTSTDPSDPTRPTHSVPPGAADRSTWACPVDPTNIHPLWEPTLPLWLEELAKVGIPTEGYKITEDAQETFKAYEADKRRRVAKNLPEKLNDLAVERIKLREE